MSEVTVPAPLSGDEIIEAVVFRVREQLKKDCFLSPNSAYETFEGKITISIRAVDCGRTSAVNTVVEAKSGAEFDDGAEGAYVVENSVEDILPEPPNVVRRETNQAVPVMAEDSSGRKEIHRVKYQRRGK